MLPTRPWKRPLAVDWRECWRPDVCDFLSHFPDQIHRDHCLCPRFHNLFRAHPREYIPPPGFGLFPMRPGDFNQKACFIFTGIGDGHGSK